MKSQLRTFVSTKYWQMMALMAREPHPAFTLVAAIATTTVVAGAIAFRLGAIYG